MIRAKFSVQGKTLKMSVRGHANAAKKGEDLICAGASMLAFTAAQDVRDMADAGRLEEKPVINLQDGRTILELTPKEDAFAEALHTLFIVQKGFVVLAANNPKYVRVKPMTA
jgi:uncharacterized protein YsxB (DUF464 family)